MNSVVYVATCTGCGRCAEICPEVFRIEEGVARSTGLHVEPPAETLCRTAADECPGGAIAVGEAQAVMFAGRSGDQRYWVAL